jgi:hypothetical protein
MKTTNSSDPLDCKIDKLFASQLLQPSADFTDRVLAATNGLAAPKKPPHTIHPWLRLALPIAALLVAAFVLTQWISINPAEPTTQTLSMIELQEIFILEEGLGGLTQLQDEDLSDIHLLNALNFLSSETQS